MNLHCINRADESKRCWAFQLTDDEMKAFFSDILVWVAERCDLDLIVMVGVYEDPVKCKQLIDLLAKADSPMKKLAALVIDQVATLRNETLAKLTDDEKKQLKEFSNSLKTMGKLMDLLDYLKNK